MLKAFILTLVAETSHPDDVQSCSVIARSGESDPRCHSQCCSALRASKCAQCVARISVGFDRLSVGFDRISVGFDSISVGVDRLSVDFDRIFCRW